MKNGLARATQGKVTMTERIYYLLDPVAGEIKIGISCNVTLRQRSLANDRGTPLILLASHLGTINDERRAHAACDSYRVAGEWFRDCEAVRAYMQGQLNRKIDDALQQVRHLLDTLDDHGKSESADWHDDMTAGISEEMTEYLRLLDFHNLSAEVAA